MDRISWKTWPSVWRLVMVAESGQIETIDEFVDEQSARSRAAELREFGWPVQLEYVAVEPTLP